MWANNEPAFFEIESINFKMNVELMNSHLIEIDFQEKNGNLSFASPKEITFLRVLNGDNEIEYQLPIFSNNIILDVKDFQKGNYQVVLILDGEIMIPSSFSVKK